MVLYRNVIVEIQKQITNSLVGAIFCTFAVRNFTKRNEPTTTTEQKLCVLYSQKWFILCQLKKKTGTTKMVVERKKSICECEIRVALQLDTK